MSQPDHPRHQPDEKPQGTGEELKGSGSATPPASAPDEPGEIGWPADADAPLASGAPDPTPTADPDKPADATGERFRTTSRRR